MNRSWISISWVGVEVMFIRSDCIIGEVFGNGSRGV